MSRRRRKMGDREVYAQKMFAKDIVRSKHMAEPGPHDLIIVLDNMKGGFNPGKIYRSAEAFGIREIHLVNMPYFDPLPSKGCLRKVKSVVHESLPECLSLLRDQGYELFAFDSRGGISLHNSELPVKAAFIMGHEEYGLSIKLDDHPYIHRMRIDQFGQVESLNVAVATSIAIYEYAKQHCYPHLQQQSDAAQTVVPVGHRPWNLS